MHTHTLSTHTKHTQKQTVLVNIHPNLKPTLQKATMFYRSVSLLSLALWLIMLLLMMTVIVFLFSIDKRNHVDSYYRRLEHELDYQQEQQQEYHLERQYHRQQLEQGQEQQQQQKQLLLLRSRHLSSERQWSWSNILFEVGVCSASLDCESNDNSNNNNINNKSSSSSWFFSCGCPDCSQPHPPNFQNNYCEMNDWNNTIISDGSSLSSSSSSSSTANNAKNSMFMEQTSWIWILLLLGVAAIAVVWMTCHWWKQKHDRIQNQYNDKTIPLGTSIPQNNSKNVSTVGRNDILIGWNNVNDDVNVSIEALSSMFTTILSNMGLAASTKQKSSSSSSSSCSNKRYDNKMNHLKQTLHNDYDYYDDDDDEDNGSVTSVKSAVSTRMALVERGVKVAAVYPDHATPHFIPLHDTNETKTNVSESNRFNSIEGTTDYRRPSSVPYQREYPSTPYAI